MKTQKNTLLSDYNFIKLCKDSQSCLNETNKEFSQINSFNSLKGKIQSNKIRSAYANAFDRILNTHEITEHYAEVNDLSKLKLYYSRLEMNSNEKLIRRGVLMNILRENAKNLPLWTSVVNERAPPLCGAVQIQKGKISKAGYLVGALVNLDSEDSEENSSEGWILGEIVSYDPEKEEYIVADVDNEDGRIEHRLQKNKVTPLPKWKANPVTNPEAIFQRGALVLALYPQTTCFYRANVFQSPKTISDDYQLLFEDNNHPDGYSPSISIPPLYVIACNEEDHSVNSTKASKSKRKKSNFK